MEWREDESPRRHWGDFQHPSNQGFDERGDEGRPPQLGAPRALLPTPQIPKIEIKTVQAEKIFDPPGRSERPSHVSIYL